MADALKDSFNADTVRAIARVLHEVHPAEWSLDSMDNMLRWTPAMDGIRAGKDLADIEATWATALTGFKAHRQPFLLYR